MKRDQIRLSVKQKINVDPKTWRLRNISPGVDVLEAMENGSHKFFIYSYRFDKNKFTLGSARQWLSSRNLTEVRRNLSFSLNSIFEKLKQS